MPCDCRGWHEEHAQLPAENRTTDEYLPAQYRHDECYGRGFGWYRYDWDESVADMMLLARYAHVLDVEIIEHVTWMQAIEMVAGYRPADDADECASLGV